MPSAQVTHDGSQPVIQATQLISSGNLILQNNTEVPIYYRIGNPVTVETGPEEGFILRPNGGSVSIPGAAARLPVYACHAQGEEAEPVILTWDKLP